MKSNYDLVVLGGGAAGFFAAIHAAEANPKLKVIILEKSRDILNKVRISGGGRCNVTHYCPEPEKLIQYYPRGHEFLLPSFKLFGMKQTWDWFESLGVRLKTESDGRVFPKSDTSESVIEALTSTAKKYGVQLKTSCGLLKMERHAEGFLLSNTENEIHCKRLILATGGHPKDTQFDAYRKLGLTCISPCPSLFTFNLKPHPYKDLQGLSIKSGRVKVNGHKKIQSGPILITHWGLSGPAIITSSAWQARELMEKEYKFDINLSWTDLSKQDVKESLQQFAAKHPKKSLHSQPALEGIPIRLWKTFLVQLGIPEFRNWAECGKKTYTALCNKLLNDQLQVNGKTTFKEEFVTAGGVELSQLDSHFQVKAIPGLYTVGELNNIDAVTGGFNFQAAWTAGYLAGMHAAQH